MFFEKGMQLFNLNKLYQGFITLVKYFFLLRL